jgi:hypothetical protein
LSWTKSWKTQISSRVSRPENIRILGHPLWSFIYANNKHFNSNSKNILYIENSSISFSKLSALRSISRDPIVTKTHFTKLLKDNLVLLNRYAIETNSIVKIRVRPSTSLKNFQAFVNSEIPKNNFIFSKNNSLQKDIRDSRLILTEMSTAALESALWNKKVALLHTLDIPKEFSYQWFSLLPKIGNYDSLVELDNNEIEYKDNVVKWMQSENSLNVDYFKDLVSLLEELQARDKKQKALSGWKFSSAKFLHSIWKVLINFPVFRRMYFRYINKRFSYSTHEVDFIPTRFYSNFRLKF